MFHSLSEILPEAIVRVVSWNRPARRTCLIEWTVFAAQRAPALSAGQWLGMTQAYSLKALPFGRS